MCRIVRSRLAATATLLLLSALGGVGQAAPRTREQRETEARTACAAGRVEDGIEILAQLLTEYGHPNYIYNQARCYQQNGRAEQAISRFKEFLRTSRDISAEERARVEHFIKELEGELPAPAPPPTETTAPPPPPVVKSEPSPAPPPDLAKAAPPPAERPRGLRTAAVALGALAVAGLTTGIVSTVQVRSLQNEIETTKGVLTLPKLNEQQKKADRFEVLQWVGYGVGAAAAGGAIVCLILDSQQAEADRAGVRLYGTVGPGGQPRLVLAGRF